MTVQESKAPTRTPGLFPRTLVAGVGVGLVAAAVSLLRLWWSNPDALTQVIWAEDGLFPLCVAKAGFLTCLVDPFAGYLLFLPRVAAGLVAALPLGEWALATNLLAALLAGITSGIAMIVLRRFGLTWFVSIAIALLPVLIPPLGMEAINALGSSYMLVLFLSTIVLAFPGPPPRREWLRTALVAVLLAVATLTIPTAGALLLAIVVQAWRRAVPLVAAAIWGAVVALGLAAQWWVASHAAIPRAMAPSHETFDKWVDSLPETILSLWPGMKLAPYDYFGVFPIVPLPITGALIAIALLGGGAFLVLRGSPRSVALGLLLLTGVAMGAVPAIIGGINNRYFIVPVLLWASAGLVALDPWVRRTRIWVVALMAALVLAIWWPSFPASWFRASPAPPWSEEVSRVLDACAADLGADVQMSFSPYWPNDQPGWQERFSEPTYPVVSCAVVWRWRDQGS